MIRRRWYTVWHQDSPGTRVTVLRRFRPRSRFARVGEPFVYGEPITLPKRVNL